jgi:glycosyltransferase involved in cell wall biosynthesis/predicted O-methyltransferase YrrM
VNSSYHVLVYTEDPGVGGVAQYNHALLSALAVRGYRVSCAQARADNPLVRRQAELGVRHLWLDFDALKDTRRTLTNEADAEQVFQAARPDLVVFSNGWPVSHFAAKRVAIRSGIPFLVVEGLVDSCFARAFAAQLDELSQHYARARAVIAVSEHNLRALRQYFLLPADRGQVIRYGRPACFFEPPDPGVRQRRRAELGVPEDAVLCLTAARLEPIKGHRHQLEAIRRLQGLPAWSRLHFAWVGPGSLAAALAEAARRLGAADRVHILGQRWDVPEWLDAADVFVLSSEAEGMPLAVMEAMAKGVPVVASAVGGIPEQVGPAGKLLPSPRVDARATAQALAETLATWATDPELRRSIGAACRERARARFREERMVAETLAVVERALLPAGDYVAPGLAVVRPDACFPHVTRGDPRANPWPYLRREVPHPWYVDRRAPHIGLLSRDEAHLLYNNALQFRGRRALEIGCFLGWSTCHLALAGVEVDALDPVLARAEAAASVRASLAAAGVLEAVHLHPGASPEGVRQLAAQARRRWSLIFVDGNHEGSAPLQDARVAEEFAEPDAMVLFHDLAAPDVARGFDYFRDRGWSTRVYQTMQLMGVAWRGNVRPVDHHPDPAVAWRLPAHLRHHSLTAAGGSPSARRETGAFLEELLRLVRLLSGGPASAAGPPEGDARGLPEWHRRGEQAWRAGDLEAAHAAFSRVREIFPGSPVANEYLAAVAWRQGDFAASVQHHLLAQGGGLVEPARDEFRELLRVVRPYTLLSEARLFSLYSLSRQLCLDDVPGHIVECGTGRGGSAALLAAVLRRYSRRERRVYAFDTFAGVPEPTAADRHHGVPANATRFGAGALAAPVADHLEAVCRALDVQDLVLPVAGLFADTLPRHRAEVGAVALLHADADWYESTLQVLEAFYDEIVPHGVLQLDDYGFWEGCRQAVRDLERRRGLCLPLRAIDGDGVWCRKEGPAGADGRHWQAPWYLAEAARQCGDIDLAGRAGRAVLRIVPGLLAAQALLDALPETAEVDLPGPCEPPASAPASRGESP